uniref:Solute carrier family 24 member 1 n=1 Tax=Oreochromis niloticus TaxID=8128 RepID=A0A669EA92_ORENI
MNCTREKQLRLIKLHFFLFGTLLCSLCQLAVSARPGLPQNGENFRVKLTKILEVESLTPKHDYDPQDQMHVVDDVETTSDSNIPTTTESLLLPVTKGFISAASKLPKERSTAAPAPPAPTIHHAHYPLDIFSTEDRRQGWEFFVPALRVIRDKLAISYDVVGATFMAAGISTPKLLGFLIGVFITHDNVDFGTVAGSAVFNVSFVIGLCALFSRQVLHLSWWPLLRNVSFYIFDLIVLIIFFLDNVIMWWENMMLVACYTLCHFHECNHLLFIPYCEKSRKFFVIAFLGSVVWFCIISYFTVWWGHQVAETISISNEIMGLTILAPGACIPYVIVARKGLGDMAVSSSVGSNIFDVTVSLPLPWLLRSLIHGLAPAAVSSIGLFCAAMLLFFILIFFIISIVCCKWKMNKVLGFTMIMLYFTFVVLSVMLHYQIIVCPV